jgi:hypothetical protein
MEQLLLMWVLSSSWRLEGYVITGDVDFDQVSKKHLYYPVPGGVGPMTIAMLLKTHSWQGKWREINKILYRKPQIYFEAFFYKDALNYN